MKDGDKPNQQRGASSTSPAEAESAPASKPVSLRPLKFEEAVKGLFKAKPEKP